MAAHTTLEDYTETDKPDHERAKHRIARILSHVTDREHAVSSADLAESVTPSASTVRDLVQQLRREELLPIVACSDGYYLVDDPEDLEYHLERIAEEIETRRETRQQLTKAFNHWNRGGGR